MDARGLVLIAVLAAVAQIGAQTPRVVVMVVDSDGQPLDRATVTFTEISTQTAHATQSNARGIAVLSAPATGGHLITVRLMKYSPASPRYLPADPPATDTLCITLRKTPVVLVLDCAGAQGCAPRPPIPPDTGTRPPKGVTCR